MQNDTKYHPACPPKLRKERRGKRGRKTESRDLYIIIGALSCAYFIIFTGIVQAQEQKIFLDKVAIEKGYEVSSPDKNFVVAILPSVLKKESDITIEEITIFPDLPRESSFLSKIYHFKIEQDSKVPKLNKFITIYFDSIEDLSRKRIFYSKDQSSWIAFASKKDKKRKRIFARVDFAAGYFALIDSKGSIVGIKQQETEPEEIILDEARINPDDKIFSYEFNDDNIKQDLKLALGENFALNIAKDTFQKDDLLSLKKFPPDNFVKPKDYKIISDIYEFDIVSPARDTRLLLRLKYDSLSWGEKVVAFLDETNDTWKVLPSVHNLEEKKIDTYTHLLYSKIAALERLKDVQEGVASWFPTRLSKEILGAASNDFKKGTKLKVTNLENRKSVIVSVVSVGPFVKDRVIDLTYRAFQKIGSPKLGTIRVRVENL